MSCVNFILCFSWGVCCFPLAGWTSHSVGHKKTSDDCFPRKAPVHANCSWTMKNKNKKGKPLLPETSVNFKFRGEQEALCRRWSHSLISPHREHTSVFMRRSDTTTFMYHIKKRWFLERSFRKRGVYMLISQKSWCCSAEMLRLAPLCLMYLMFERPR